jgi:hypothetical protein
MNWPSAGDLKRKALHVASEFAGSGPLHRRRLADIAVRVSVTGVRGKSTATRWLHDILYDRGYDTYAKVTGTDPVSIYNGTEHEIDRPEKVTLYENERELRKFGNVEAAVVENQGIRPYTTRLVNEQYVRPHVVFLTNVREDHLDTLGENRLKIARALARSVPEGTHVVCGVQNERIKDYLNSELERRNATASYVQVPAQHRHIPGAEVVHGLNQVLHTVGEPPLDPDRREAYLDRMTVSWMTVPQGRVYDAAAVNDTRSVELVRRQLVGESREVIQPLVYLRADRRGRTASFLEYLDLLETHDRIEQARVVGQEAGLFARHASFPVVTHDEETEAPGEVLAAALGDGWPVLVMGNTVSEFMKDLSRRLTCLRIEGIFA